MPHSRYDISFKLANGRMLGENSTNVGGNTTSLGQHDELSANASFVPPSMEHFIPTYFSKHGCNDFNPLHHSIPSIFLIWSNPIATILALDLADNWELTASLTWEPASKTLLETSLDQPLPCFWLRNGWTVRMKSDLQWLKILLKCLYFFERFI